MIFRVGITESERNASICTGCGKSTPSERTARRELAARGEHLGERPVGEQARDRERQLGEHAIAVGDDEPAAELAQPSHRAEHRGVVGADDDQVVRVVGDGRAERAAAEAEAADEAEPDPAGLEVALEDGDLGEVAGRVGDREPVPGRQLVDERRRDDLVGDEPDHARLAAAPRDRQVGRLEPADVDGALHPLRHDDRRDLADRPAALQDALGQERDEVVEEEDVGPAAGRDRPEVVEAVVGGRVQARQHDRVLGGDAEGDRVADDRVDVTVVGDVLGLAVVGAERQPARPVLGDERDERLQVARARALADQQPEPGAQALAPLLERRGLVVGLDPGRGVGVQLPVRSDRARGRRRAGRAGASRARSPRPCRRRGSSSSPRARARASAAAAPRGRRSRARGAATRSARRGRTRRP